MSCPNASSRTRTLNPLIKSPEDGYVSASLEDTYTDYEMGSGDFFSTIVDDGGEIDPNLEGILFAWPNIPGEIRLALLAMVRTVLVLEQAESICSTLAA